MRLVIKINITTLHYMPLIPLSATLYTVNHLSLTTATIFRSADFRSASLRSAIYRSANASDVKRQHKLK